MDKKLSFCLYLALFSGVLNGNLHHGARVFIAFSHLQHIQTINETYR